MSIKEYITFILELGAKLIVITDGANAVHVSCSNYSAMIDVPKITPIDTTGAGDSFISGFLYSLAKTATNKNTQMLFNVIEQRNLVSTAILFAARCGAYACGKKGGFTALPKLTDL